MCLNRAGPSGPQEPLPWAGGSDPAGWSSPAGLRHMSGSELMELLDQVEGAIRDFSEELVQQLARRDELEFEKEVKNSFITVLIEVQNKQKEQRELMKKRRKEKGLSLQSSRIDKGSQMPLKVRGQPGTRTRGVQLLGSPLRVPGPDQLWPQTDLS